MFDLCFIISKGEMKGKEMDVDNFLGITFRKQNNPPSIGGFCFVDHLLSSVPFMSDITGRTRWFTCWVAEP